MDPAELPRYVTRLDAEGFQVHVHAIGDRAVRDTLDAFQAARAANGARDNRHHMAHLQVVHPDDMPRFGALGVTANGQPLWASNDPAMTDLTLPVIGPERGTWQYPFGGLLRAGATLAFGSDWPVSSPDVLQEIHVAVNRTTPPGFLYAGGGELEKEPFLPEHRISLAQAIRAFTMGSAFVNHLDDRTGSIEVGKLADLVVLSEDLFGLDPAEITQAKVDMTFVDGSAVYERAGSVRNIRMAKHEEAKEMTEVHILSEGYIHESETELRVGSTVGFVRDGDALVVIDPGMVPGVASILDPLTALGVAAGDVTDVVISHHHPDHTVNIALFPHAQIHDHWATYRGDLWIDRPAEGFDVSPNVSLIETPGHTPQDITTLVTPTTAWSRSRICGGRPRARPTIRTHRTWRSCGRAGPVCWTWPRRSRPGTDRCSRPTTSRRAEVPQAYPTSAATRSTTSRQNAPTWDRSSMNCDGLMQMVVKPRAT